MTNIQQWFFVDDKSAEAESFAAQLSDPAENFLVQSLDPAGAREKILGGAIAPSGILMDVDFSAIPGELGTGLGISQDIRAKQKAKEIQDFAIVRFAGAIPVDKNIGGDPTSDDLFDLKIDKSEVSINIGAVRTRLCGVYEVYRLIGEEKDLDDTKAISRILDLKADRLEEWSHSSFHRRLADNRAQSVHVAAGTFMRAFLDPSGLLVDEILLSFRLGVDMKKSGVAWDELRTKHLAEFAYTGVAHKEFPRWWGRGLDDWWLDTIRDEAPLASRNIHERHDLLVRVTTISDLVPLEMPATSLGTRPWRLCSLHLERVPAEFVPVDPEFGVRVTRRTDLPPWVDPAYAELGEAMRRKEDRRLSESDMQNLVRRIRRQTGDLGQPTDGT